MNLPLIKNDITTIFYRYDTCVLLQIHVIEKAEPFDPACLNVF